MNISDYICTIILFYNIIIFCFIYVKRYLIYEDKERASGIGERLKEIILVFRKFVPGE
jgi:hypothetical protein